MNYLYQEIEKIRHRPAMYLGRMSITALCDYLNGFQSATNVFGKNAIEKLFPLPFWFFDEYVANHYGEYGSPAGWRNIILKETHFDEEKSIEVFYDLFDKYPISLHE